MSSSSNRRRRRIRQGLCGVCGKRRGKGSTKTLCKKCREKSIDRARKYRLKKLSLSEHLYCNKCGAKRDDPRYVVCTKCKKASTKSKRPNKRKIRNQKGKKFCIDCGKPAYPGYDKCPKHLVVNIIRKYDSADNWPLYWDKLVQQDFKCYYSGVKLIPGRNLSLDHVVPRSKGGSCDASNCVWCDKYLNFAKNDLTLEQFVIRCKKVAEKFPEVK